jgi:hypothetical protein
LPCFSRPLQPRTIHLTGKEVCIDRSLSLSLILSDTQWYGWNQVQEQQFPQNVIRNQKYSVLTFLPVVLFEQFNQFCNLYFLLIALSQFIPALGVGMLLATAIQ